MGAARGYTRDFTVALPEIAHSTAPRSKKLHKKDSGITVEQKKLYVDPLRIQVGAVELEKEDNYIETVSWSY